MLKIITDVKVIPEQVLKKLKWFNQWTHSNEELIKYIVELY